MFKHVRLFVSAAGFLSVGLYLINADANPARGPFPIRPSRIENMTFTFNRKLERPTQSLALATNDPSGMKLTDGLLTLQNDAKIKIPAIDPVTSLPLLDEKGNPVFTFIVYPAGTVLDPKSYPTDDILLPKGVTVSAIAIADGDYSIGRFGYLGVAPRFKSENLEMVASKMGHSLRVKAFVTQETLDTYEFTLLSRFRSYYDMLWYGTVHLEPLRDLGQMAASSKNSSRKKWYTVAAYYSKHLYENPDLDIYANPSSEAEYKRTLLTAMIRTYLRDPSMTVEAGLALFDRYRGDPNFILSRREASTALFKAQFKGIYAEGPPAIPRYPIEPLVAPVPAPSPLSFPSPVPSPTPSPVPHADALGYLTFVYPIAIDKDGPFKLPSPGLRKFPLSSSIEGRWFSNRWLDEFGGFPFLQITDDGVAFHGPITMSENETWFLRRDNVSHSCMRMDASDIMELRSLLPRNMNQLQKLKQTIPLWITEWPDVTDVDNNGTNEVVDVAYYTIPTSGDAIKTVANWHPAAYNKSYWTKHFAPYAKSKRLKSRNTFTLTTTSTVDETTGEVKTVNGGVFTGLPKYGIVNGVLKIVGFYTEELPIMTLPQRPNQIIQYREDGTVYSGADNDGADRSGRLPPAVVNKY